MRTVRRVLSIALVASAGVLLPAPEARASYEDTIVLGTMGVWGGVVAVGGVTTAIGTGNHVARYERPGAGWWATSYVFGALNLLTGAGYVWVGVEGFTSESMPGVIVWGVGHVVLGAVNVVLSSLAVGIPEQVLGRLPVVPLVAADLFGRPTPGLAIELGSL